MLKRVTWWASGVVMGAVGSRWAERKVKAAVNAQVEKAKEAAKPSNLAKAGVQAVKSSVGARSQAVRDRVHRQRGEAAPLVLPDGGVGSTRPVPEASQADSVRPSASGRTAQGLTDLRSRIRP